MDNTYLLDNEHLRIINLGEMDRWEIFNFGQIYQNFFIDNKTDYEINVWATNIKANGKSMISNRSIAQVVPPKRKGIGKLYINLYDIGVAVNTNEEQLHNYSFNIVYRINGENHETEEIKFNVKEREESNIFWHKSIYK